MVPEAPLESTEHGLVPNGDGIFERRLYNERPERYEYRLTEKGLGLFTALNALRQWGDEHLSAAPMRCLRRKSDGVPVIAALVPEGSAVLAYDVLEIIPGPGFPRDDRRS